MAHEASVEISLYKVISRIHQAQAVLSLWHETLSTDDGNIPDMIEAVLTLLDGLPDAIVNNAEDK